jgi:alkyldihydroxyacetonephosphate synthase
VLGVDVDPAVANRPQYPTEIPAPRPAPDFTREIQAFLGPDQIVDDGEIRLRHGHGHTQAEMYAIKYGKLGRIPDLVVFPDTGEDVTRLVEAAARHDATLIPYGGGTNVTDALRCRNEETRAIISVDMRRLNRVIWIDKKNMMASIEAGAPGRLIMAELARYGVTMGHEPDSVEFSTLGGWIATNASGMKKNRYGNIEDLVIDVRVATTSGTLARSGVSPRESVGLDLGRLILGSEGTLGIVTSAIVKIFALPETQEYGSVLFPTYEDGFRFAYDLAHETRPPASVRLVDNMQFQFGLALKPRSGGGLAALRSRAERLFVTRIKGFDPEKMVACTLVFEGAAREVDEQQKDVYRIARRHRGMKAGSENGRRGYQLTFSIAYIRDFLMNYFIIAESFETSVAWSDALTLIGNVERRIRSEYAERGLPGRPYVTSRVTQLYQTGVCIYFYFGFYYKDVPNPQDVYLEIENAARDEILRSGGSLSHHHGVGKLRRQYLPRIMSPAILDWKRQIKRTLDPGNVFGAANQDPDLP